MRHGRDERMRTESATLTLQSNDDLSYGFCVSVAEPVAMLLAAPTAVYATTEGLRDLPLPGSMHTVLSCGLTGHPDGQANLIGNCARRSCLPTLRSAARRASGSASASSGSSCSACATLLRTKSWRAVGAGAGAPGHSAARALRPLLRAAAQAQYPGLRRSYSSSSRSYRSASAAQISANSA